MIKVEAVYVFAGIVFAAVALFSALDRTNPRRALNGVFWGLFAASFLIGGRLGDFGNGLLVLALVASGAVVRLGQGRPATTSAEERTASAARWGSRLFLPVLVIPASALAGTIAFTGLKLGGRQVLSPLTWDGVAIVDPKQATVIAMAAGVLLALVIAMAMLRPPPAAPAQEARRILDQVGAVAILPQLLAALGAVFVLAGVGDAVGRLIGGAIPLTNRVAVVAAYALGMTAFTMIMGNAFAAFPVLTAAIGAPLIVRRFGGDAAAMGAIGMLAGYCGTLMTPMASHNIVPTALLQLPPWAVIRAQAPTALIVLCANIVLMWLLVFR